MPRRQTIAIAAALMLLLAAIAFWPGGETGTTPDESASLSSNPPVTALVRSGPLSSIPRRKAKLEPAEPAEDKFDPYEEWEMSKILNHFMVPPGRMEADNIGGAMRELESIYAEHSGGRLLNIEAQPPRDFGASFAFDYGSVSIGQLMGIVAALGGYKLMVGDANVALVKKEPPEASDEIANRRFRVPPTYSAQTGKRPPQKPDEKPPAKEWPTTPEDPFAAKPESPPTTPWTVFETYGVTISEDVQIDVDPKTSTWNVTGPAAEVELIGELLSATAFGSVQHQVHLSHKIVTAKNGATIDPQTFADESAFIAAMGELSANPNIEVVSAPSVVTRSGQRTKIEIIREFIYPTEHDATGNPTQFDMRPVGLTIESDPMITGLDRMHLRGSAEITTLDSQDLNDFMSDGTFRSNPSEAEVDAWGGTADSFQSHATDYAGYVLDGNTAVFLTAQDNGTTVYQIVTVRRIDPAGNSFLAAP